MAVNFLITFLYNKLPRRRVDIFGDELAKELTKKFRGHWYPSKPSKGSGYRCLLISHTLDPVLVSAAKESGLALTDVKTHLPEKLSLWIDPREVSYRIGENGTVNVIYKKDKSSEAEDLCDVETAKWVNLLNGQDGVRSKRAASPKSFEIKNNRRSPLLVSTSSPSVSSAASFSQHYSPYSTWSTLDDSSAKHALSQLSPNAKEFTSSRKQPHRSRSPRAVSDFSTFTGVQSWNLSPTQQEVFGVSETLKNSQLVTSNSYFDYFNYNHLSPYKGSAYSSQLPIAMA